MSKNQVAEVIDVSLKKQETYSPKEKKLDDLRTRLKSFARDKTKEKVKGKLYIRSIC